MFSHMLKRRLWTNFPFLLLFGVLTYGTVWQFVSFPTSSTLWPVETVYTLYKDSSNYTYPMHLLPPNDYNRLFDLNFSFSILNSVDYTDSLLLIILVHSAPENTKKRKAIRETWGRQTDDKVRVVFAIGSVVSDEVQNALEQENKNFKDLVQGSFLDTYRNLTYKHLMVFKYAIYHVPQAKYILKTDDDVFVNMPSMRNFLTVDMSPYGANRMLFCTLRKSGLVVRSYRSKWRVSFLEYKEKRYPNFCPGWILLYSPDVVFDLYRAAQTTTDYFWIDDIHITGTMAHKTGIVHTDIESLVISQNNMNNIVDDLCNVSTPFLFGKHNLNEKTIRKLWKYVSKHQVPESVIKTLESGQ